MEAIVGNQRGTTAISVSAIALAAIAGGDTLPENRNCCRGILLLDPLRPRLLPLARFPLQLLGPGVVALLGRASFLVYVVMVSPGVGGDSGACEKGNQKQADGEFSHSSA